MQSCPEPPPPEQPKSSDFIDLACDDPGQLLLYGVGRLSNFIFSRVYYNEPYSSHEGIHLRWLFTTFTFNCLFGTFLYISHLRSNRAYGFTHEQNLRKEQFRCIAMQPLWAPIIVPRFSPAFHALYPLQRCSLSLESRSQRSSDEAQRLHQYCW
jgi:hypothetical protein